MKRSRCIVALVLIAVYGCDTLQIASARPKVVVILTDDQGWGDLGCHGNTNLKTPNIDALASSGASFANFVVCPMCAPTRAEFLTGRYHPRTGVGDVTSGGERMNADEKTIADAFQESGYATAAFGKWHNGSQGPYHPNARGFDEFYGFCSGHWGNYFNPMLDHNGRPVRGHGFIADDFTDHAIEFIEQHRSEPFFVYLAFNTPHSPMQVPDKWFDRFRDHPVPLRGTGPTAEDLEHTRAALAMCENIDDNVGRLLKKLDELKLAEDTIVVYFHDNGPNGTRWNGKLRGIKGSLDEGGVRSPLFLRWPRKVKSGKQVKQVAGAIDLLPTLLDLADVPRVGTKELDGVSHRALLTGDTQELRDRTLYSTWKGTVSARTQRFRLDAQGRLYDLVRDPAQSRDVAHEFPNVSADLKSRIAEWRRDVLPTMQPDTRPFVVGHPVHSVTILPAADAQLSGEVTRSNRYPNCSFITNWKSVDDAITWNVDVARSGSYRVTIGYTCPKANVGTTFEVRLAEHATTATVSKPHNPPLRGAEHDRIPRQESYVKDFANLDAGVIELPSGKNVLKLKALDSPGKQVMDFGQLMLEYVEAED